MPAPFFCLHPHLSRRRFFDLLGAGVSGAWLAGPLRGGDVAAKQRPTVRGTARNVIFVLANGAISHVDTFDYKDLPGQPASILRPSDIDGVRWPSGLLPKLARSLPDMAIVRSVLAWALQHSLGQQWMQIGRNPAGPVGPIAPNIGSVVALEKAAERMPDQVFPSFLALNSAGSVGSGYMSTAYAPLKVDAAAGGLPLTSNVDGEQRLDSKLALMNLLDGPLRTNSPLGFEVEQYDGFYKAARGLMFNPTVDRAFRFTGEESARYGASGFGNACVVAHKVLRENQGTRYIQITHYGYDNHENIYDTAAVANPGLPVLARQLDDGLSALFADLKSSGLFDETLVVLMGEFGRTPEINGTAGRDHHQQQFAMFAGGGVKGGQVLGATNSTGDVTVDYGWSENRHVRSEDIIATIYSALGIDWTTVRYDDPLQRGYIYVPEGYVPIDALWA